MDYKKDIPIFLISYNRLTYLSALVCSLEKYGYTNIHIVDNHSSYPPLLEYLRSSKHVVHFLEKNYKHRSVWTCGRFKKIISTQFYAVSDCDVVPIENCPDNFIEYFHSVLMKYPKITKVGFSLKIDDLPDCYIKKNEVIEWEKNFWNDQIEEGLYKHIIDTTFALYRPGIYPSKKKWWESIRTGAPYSARHLPWYENSANQNDEDKYYQNTIAFEISDWSHITTQVDIEQYKRLLTEYRRLKKKQERIKELYIFVPKFWKIDIYKKIFNRFFPKKRNHF